MANAGDRELRESEQVELQCFECETVASIELEIPESEGDLNNDQIVLQSIEKSLPKNFMLL